MSEVTKHTPGPWSEANGNRHYGFSISAPAERGRKLIAETIGIDTIPLNRGRYKEGPETVANATLIANSPLMFDVLRRLVAYSEITSNCYVCGHVDSHEIDCPVPHAREAIAKAEGR